MRPYRRGEQFGIHHGLSAGDDPFNRHDAVTGGERQIVHMFRHGEKPLAALCFAHDFHRGGEKLPALCGNGFRVGGTTEALVDQVYNVNIVMELNTANQKYSFVAFQ